MPELPEFGEMKPLDLRKVWPGEATHFTPWLFKNMQELGTAIGMELEAVEEEASVGDFSLDLLAKDLGTDRYVIIENQFGTTDHNHLGKLITYAARFDALTVVWISESIRKEHRSALKWLNQRTELGTRFFGVEVEVFQIDDSKPAFKLRPVVFPDEWQKEARPPERKSSSRGEAYRTFFQNVIDELREKHKFTGARLAQPQSWYTFSSSFTGVSYGLSFAQGKRARAEIFIDQGDADRNKRLFDWLAQSSKEIEEEFGEPMQWERLDDRRASRIAAYRPGSIDDDEETLNEIRAWGIARLLKLKKVFLPRLKNYKNLRTLNQE